MKEPVPHVVFDINVGRIMQDIKINYETLVAYMRSEGFDDTEIGATLICFSGEDTSSIDEHGERQLIRGRYSEKNGAITLYPNWALTVFNDIAAFQLDIDKFETLRRHMSKVFSEVYSSTLVHELEHKKLHLRKSHQETDGIRNSVASQELGRAALTMQNYLEDPEEAHCRTAAESGPKHLVRFQIKASPNY